MNHPLDQINHIARMSKAALIKMLLLCSCFIVVSPGVANASAVHVRMACHDPQGIDCQTPEAIQKTESESWLLSTLRTKPKTVSLIVFFKNSDQVIVRTNTENLRITTLGDTDKNAIQSAATSAGVSWTVNSGYSSNDWTFYFWALGIGLMLGAILTRQAFLRQLKKAGIVPNEFGELPKGQGGFNRSDPTNGMDKHRAQVFEPDQLDGPKLEQFIGQEEAVDQVMGILPFLKEESREKLTAMGARMPRGILMVGPPGVGKTFLTRILATMAGVPVFATSGSEFNEMFVGVGASRIRDLFEAAKKRAPCIIFIDELDGVAANRGGLNSNSDGNSTLNQLLVEMDGFEDRTGVIVFAATNRKDIIDPAAIRPGRFDRIVTFHHPTKQDREKLLAAYLPENFRAQDVNLSTIARITSRASGADLENLDNEAKIKAVMAGRDLVTAEDLDEAAAIVTVGERRTGLILSEPELDTVAWHEGGHALTFLKRTGRAPLRFSMVPRGNTLGHVTYDEEFETKVTREALETQLVVGMGGWAGLYVGREGEEDTGVSADMQMATKIAYDMVTKYGMSDRVKISLSGYPDARLIPESLNALISTEVDKLLAWAKAEALNIIQSNREDMRRLVAAVREKETLREQDFIDMFLSGNNAIEKSAVLSTPNQIHLAVVQQKGQSKQLFGLPSLVTGLPIAAIKLRRMIRKPSWLPRWVPELQRSQENTPSPSEARPNTQP